LQQSEIITSFGWWVFSQDGACLLCPVIVEDLLVREGGEANTVANVEFVLEFDPVKTKRVQERRQRLHDQKHGDRRTGPHGPRSEQNGQTHATLERADQHAIPEHGREL